MNKTLLVLRNELVTTLTRRSFLFTAFVLPLLGFLLFEGVTALNSNSPDLLTSLVGQLTQEQHEGYVDPSGFLVAPLETVDEETLVEFPDEASAQTALRNGEITAYYLIPADFVETGELTYVRPDFTPMGGESASPLMEYALLVNLLGGDEKLAAEVQRPLNTNVTNLAPPEAQRDEDNPYTFWVPYLVTLIYYVIIMSSASLLLQSVSKEKETRVIEVLMVSVSPRQLLSGKIAGLGIAGLLQTIIWSGLGYTLLRVSGRSGALPASLSVEPSLLVWGLVFFVLGYSLYATLMAGLGALVPNLREATQATILVIFPLIIPILFISVLIEVPNGILATILSLIPFTAPVAMMTRLTAASVPLWQPILAAALMLGTVLLAIRAVSRMFQAQTLLSGQPFQARRFLRTLLKGV